jgi:hypothetical protein
MIDLNDRFVGLVLGLLMIVAFAAYIAFFTKPEEEPSKSKKR